MANHNCYTCGSFLSWEKRAGVGKYGGFWKCPSGCQEKFPPQGSTKLDPKSVPNAKNGDVRQDTVPGWIKPQVKGGNAGKADLGLTSEMAELLSRLDYIKKAVSEILDILNENLPKP